jgi:hypothetical protein
LNGRYTLTVPVSGSSGLRYCASVEAPAQISQAPPKFYVRTVQPGTFSLISTPVLKIQSKRLTRLSTKVGTTFVAQLAAQLHTNKYATLKLPTNLTGFCFDSGTANGSACSSAFFHLPRSLIRPLHAIRDFPILFPTSTHLRPLNRRAPTSQRDQHHEFAAQWQRSRCA